MSQPPYPGPPYPEQPYSGQPDSGQPYPGQPSSGQPYPGQPGSGQPYPGQPSSGQPYPGQPSSGEPYPGQPYPGQPSSGQPAYGQPYPSQPYQGQPNPDVPTSVPPQPGYPSPPTPAYGQQPGYAQQPGYGQTAAYGQPAYGQQPGYPVAPPPKKKSKALPIVLVSIAVVLVLCVGGGVAIFLAAKNKADDITTGVQNALPTPTVTVDDPTTEPTGSSSTITIVEPKTLGGRPKLTDEQFAAIAEQLKSGLAAVPDAGNTVGALYGTIEKQNIVVIAAAEAPVEDPAKELNGTFLGAGIGGLKVTGITTVPAGTLGGEAKCGNADASGVKMAMCGWADSGSVGWVIWYFKSASQVKSEFPKLRAQIEKSS